MKRLKKTRSLDYIKKKIQNEYYKSIETNTEYTPVFYTSNEKKISGKIFGSYSTKKIDVVLYTQTSTYDKKNDIITNNIYFFDSNFDARRAKINIEYTCQMYVYEFETHYSKYIILSKNQLECNKYQLEGLELITQDFLKTGEESKLKTKTRFFIVHKSQPFRKKLTEKEFKNYINIVNEGLKDYDYIKGLYSNFEDKSNLEFDFKVNINQYYSDFLHNLSVNLFWGFRHPKWFEIFIFALFFGFGTKINEFEFKKSEILSL